MKLIALSRTAPHPYPRPDILKPLRGDEQTFERFVSARLRRFKRDSVVSMGIQLFWILWRRKNEEVPVDTGGLSNMLVKMYGAQVMALGATFCSKDGRADILEAEFRNLCWEFAGIRETISDRRWLEQVLIPQLEAEIAELPPSSLLKKIPRDDLRIVSAYAFKARLAAAQWEAAFSYQSDWYRNWLIFKVFREGCEGFKDPSFEQLVKRWLRLGPANFVPACFCLNAMGLDSASKSTGESGFIDFETRGVGEDVTEMIGIKQVDLRLVASLLSTDFDEFDSNREELSRLPEPLKKYAIQTDWFRERPIIQMSEYSPDGASRILIPSPWHLFFRSRDYLLRETVACLDTGLGRTSANSTMKILGDAYDQYLRTLLREHKGIKDLNQIFEPEESKADFYWPGQKINLIIECKLTLKIDQKINLSSPTAVIGHWAKAEKAIVQAEATRSGLTQRKLLDEKERRTGLIIVTNDPLSEEGGSFMAAAKKWGFLADTGITFIWVISTAEFEHFAFREDADELGRLACEVWDNLRPDDIDMRIRPEGLAKKTGTLGYLPHIEQARRELFGKFASLKEQD